MRLTGININNYTSQQSFLCIISTSTDPTTLNFLDIT